jgi:hypothetical protein
MISIRWWLAHFSLSVGEVGFMVGEVTAELDFIEELRLRRWARENYVPPMRREVGWHPVVLDEMHKKDGEGIEADTAFLGGVRC